MSDSIPVRRETGWTARRPFLWYSLFALFIAAFGLAFDVLVSDMAIVLAAPARALQFVIVLVLLSTIEVVKRRFISRS